MRSLHNNLVAAAIAVLSFCAFPISGQNRRQPIFVSPEQLNVAAILPDPPADNSARAKAELAEVHRLQDTHQRAQIAYAKADDAEEDIFIFKDVLGPQFTASALPATALLSAHLHNDESVISGPAKKQFRRLRPFNFDHSVNPVCKTNNDITDYAYPSGHSLSGYLEALTLVLIVPEKRDAILARADDYAFSRVVCGVHYPSDTAASKLVAYAIMGSIMKNPRFVAELASARTETRRVLGLPEIPGHS